jgi:2-iminobutanoate/2-iminopropanoate deaminase
LNRYVRSMVAAAAVVVPIAAIPANTARHYIVLPTPDKRPFSQAVEAGGTLYIAGSLGLDPKTGQAPADTKLEMQLVMEAVRQTVEASGYQMDDLVDLKIFCTDLTLYAAFNEIYLPYFHGHLPARSFIGVDKLLRGAHIEVAGIAVKK